tara:strand:+ start:27 stop:548 length:522 start_codon:yes stop_codon:yes gene_type:complete
MNIFYLHPDPVKAAQIQYNKHVVKMVLESAQMLCTAHHCYGNAEQKLNVPYKQAHLNHPSTVWARKSRATYRWLYLHMMALGDEYTKRYGKTHLTITKCAKFLNVAPVHIQGDEWSEPPQAMPDQYKVPGCSITAYWNYYEGEKYTIATKDEMLITRDKLYGKKKIIPTFDTA